MVLWRWVSGWWLDQLTLEAFSSLNDAVVQGAARRVPWDPGCCTQTRSLTLLGAARPA